MDEIKFIPTERLFKDIEEVMIPRLQSLYSGKIDGKGSGSSGSKHFADRYTKMCEEKINSLINRRYTLLTTSGTASITLMLMAQGIGPGDEVICTNYSCPATVMPIKMLGAKPVFIDLNKYGQQDLTSIKSLISSKTKAIMITDLYGDCNDYDEVLDLGIPILNDSAQSLLTTYKGKQTLSLGDMSILSFSTNKNCPVFGTHGSISTDNEELARILTVMRKNGYANRDVGESINCIGINAYPSEDKGVQLLCSLEMLDKWQARRQEIADLYKEKLINVGVAIRPSPEFSVSNNHKFVILVANKQDFRDKMFDQGVETQLHYTYNFMKTPVLSNDTAKNMPGTEFYQKHAISIPSNPWLSDKETVHVIEAIKKCLTKEDQALCEIM